MYDKGLLGLFLVALGYYCTYFWVPGQHRIMPQGSTDAPESLFGTLMSTEEAYSKPQRGR